MKTVPTLCASATSIGVAALGLALGRPVSHEPDAIVQQQQQIHQQQQDQEQHPLPQLSQANAAPPLFTRPVYSSHSPLSPTFPPVRENNDGRVAQGRLHRRASQDQSHQLSAALDDSQVAESDAKAGPPRSGASWLKRLSIVSTSTTSRDTSPRPNTPSISNGSMAFSHDGSTAPMIDRALPQQLPPNKLVKRSSSMRTSNLSHPNSKGPTFRRPATSHQRSATLQHQPIHTEPLLESPAIATNSITTVQEPRYTHFFRTELSKDKSIAKKRGLAGESKGWKRLLPEKRHPLVLLPPKSITACALEAEENSDADSVTSNSRPSTPNLEQRTHQPDLEQTQDPGPTELAHARVPNPALAAEPETRARRSFSITDLLGPGQHGWKQRVPRPEVGKLRRKSSRRASSAPLTTLAPSAMSEDADKELLGNGRHSSSMTTSNFPPLRSFSSGNTQSTADNDHRPRAGSNALVDSSFSTFNPGTRRRNRTLSAPGQVAVRTPRHSLASEQASTLAGSEFETRGLGSGDEDDLDFQSDTVFDSIRTRTTRSTSVSQGPPIETIFDESPPSKDRTSFFFLRDLRRGSEGAGDCRITEEDEHGHSPARTITAATVRDISPSRHIPNGSVVFPAAPPGLTKPLSLGRLEWDAPPEGDDGHWTFSGDEDDEDEGEDDLWVEPRRHLPAPSATPSKQNRLSSGAASRSSLSTPRMGHSDHGDKDARSSIFDWSEQPPQDKSPGNGTPPRPRTVHGKKDADVRGSRSIGRRAPSSLHARSQSVPVVPDAIGKREPVVTNKFGTWGVGSKGVTEDWDDDFDFSSPQEKPTENEDVDESARVDSGFAMLVPKAIQEQQTKVLANIGLLREWGLLIEELKELRMRAVSLGLLEGQQSTVWEEVDAMIDLADQEVDEPTMANGSPSSLADFDFDFDDNSSTPVAMGRSGRKVSGGRQFEAFSNGIPQLLPHGRTHRQSILASSNGLYEGKSTSPTPRPAQSLKTPPRQTGRPRKDSEAVARSVIEALQKRRSTVEAADANDSIELPTPANKVPFDTGTLKHIVPYVHGLMRKVKDVLREAEGLNISPHHSIRHIPKPLRPHTPLSDLFKDTSDIKELNESPSSGKELMLKSNNAYTIKEKDLATQMKFMTVM